MVHAYVALSQRPVFCGDKAMIMCTLPAVATSLVVPVDLCSAGPATYQLLISIPDQHPTTTMFVLAYGNHTFISNIT